MEWVEVTAKSVESAKELALDRLGIGVDDAEFDVVEEPRPGLFGRVRGEARVRARVKPTMVRQKQERRGRRSNESSERVVAQSAVPNVGEALTEPAADVADPAGTNDRGGSRRRRSSARRSETTAASDVAEGGDAQQGGAMEHDRENTEPVAVEDVRAAAEEFARGLVEAFGLQGSTSSVVDGTEIEVRIDADGNGLGLLIGPSGRTLLAIQDLARVAAQRRLGDHETRLRIDVAGYREKRRGALERFASEVADLVKESGVARSLEPMPSSDRKVIHDTLATIDGVVSRSEGEDPNRRIIVSPA
ncbi:MAG TPA: R3H domain-containing nucleic acid-binding protein [Desertimonas sp.]|nr:R3H domain-containing nucleic acid-binding protein [Desertimonas sp.]